MSNAGKLDRPALLACSDDQVADLVMNPAKRLDEVLGSCHAMYMAIGSLILLATVGRLNRRAMKLKVTDPELACSALCNYRDFGFNRGQFRRRVARCLSDWFGWQLFLRV
jgi:hypothetical protein